MTIKSKAPALRAELIIVKPYRLIVGLQHYYFDDRKFDFTPWRYLLDEENYFKRAAWNEIETECELHNQRETVRFTGRFEDADTKTDGSGRHYPWARLENIQIVERRNEPHDFSKTNTYSRLGRKQYPPVKGLMKIALATHHYLSKRVGTG